MEVLRKKNEDITEIKVAFNATKINKNVIDKSIRAKVDQCEDITGVKGHHSVQGARKDRKAELKKMRCR